MSFRPFSARSLVAALLIAVVLGAAPAPAETQRVPPFVVDRERPIATFCRALHVPQSPVRSFLQAANAPDRSVLERLERGRQAVLDAIGTRPKLDVLCDAMEGGRLKLTFAEGLERLVARASSGAAQAIQLASAINYVAYDQQRKIASTIPIPHAAHPKAVAFVLQELLQGPSYLPDDQARLVVLALLHDLIEDNVHPAVRSLQVNSAVLQVIDPQAVPAGLPLSERLTWSTAAARDALNEAFPRLKIPGAGGVGDAVAYMTEPPSPHGFRDYVGVPKGAVGANNLRQRTTRAAVFTELVRRGGQFPSTVKIADHTVNADTMYKRRHGDSRGLPLALRLLHGAAARCYSAGRLDAVPGVPGRLKAAFDDMMTEVLNSPEFVRVTGADRWCELCRLEHGMARFADDNRPLIQAHVDAYLAKLAALP